MDALSVPMEAITYETLTFARAQYDGASLVALGTDQPWETWTVANLLSERPAKWELSLIATLGEQPVGYAIASARADSIHLHHLIVGKPWRGRSIGHQLLCHLAGKAQSRGTQYLSLKVHKHNPKAIAFYCRHGFTITEEQHPELLTMRATVADNLARGPR
jgi:ribosomal protein S18 acetylase RimI-like enzyme